MSVHKNITQQSKVMNTRSGYPLSSELFNDAFDSILYDLLGILTTENLTVPDRLRQIFEGLSHVEASAFRLRKESVEDILNDHTTNWRHI